MAAWVQAPAMAPELLSLIRQDTGFAKPAVVTATLAHLAPTGQIDSSGTYDETLTVAPTGGLV